MPVVYRKQLASGLYIRKYDRYINADTGGSHTSTNDDPSRLQGYLDQTWSGEGASTTINRSGLIATLDTHVACGVFLANETGTWNFRIRADDAGYLWVGSNAEALEWNLNKNNAVGDAGGAHGALNGDGTASLTSGVYYAIKAMVGDRGGGDTFIIDFKAPSEGALSNTGRNGTGFYFHNPYAPNGYNLDS